MDKKPVDSIVRTQAVALSDAGLSQVQISIFPDIVYKMPSTNTMKLINTMTCNEQAVQKTIQSRENATSEATGQR